MSRWLPCKRRIFIKRLRALEFHGPHSGSRHQFMVYKEHRMAIPTNDEYSVPQIRMLLNEVAAIIGRTVSVDEWNREA